MCSLNVLMVHFEPELSRKRGSKLNFVQCGIFNCAPVVPLSLCVYLCSRLADILTSNCHFDNLLCAADAASTCCCSTAVLLAQPMHRMPVVLFPAFPLLLKCFSISFNEFVSAQLPLKVRRSYSSQLNRRTRSCPFFSQQMSGLSLVASLGIIC